MALRVYYLQKGSAPKQMLLSPDESILDKVTLRLPQGVYSTFRTYECGKKVLGLQAHLNRLYTPALQQNISPSIGEKDLRQELRKLIELFQSAEVRIRIILSLADNPGQVFVMLEELPLIPEGVYMNGVRGVTSIIKRINPRLKTTAFIQSSADERKSILTNGIYEALMMKNYHITEGLTSNFYGVKGTTIITARYGILLGVTRRAVLRILRKDQYAIEYRGLRIDELYELDEAFISSSSRGIVPMIEIDGRRVGQGFPGKVSIRLRQEYNLYVAANAENI
jgi:branched-subunit amino acid aminotransferase/4-amino-4-deoxychorismate lyase